MHTVGDFVASFVPSVADFDRIDPRFHLPEGTLSALPEYADYGFAVFELRNKPQDETRPHPMAFLFATRDADRIFFPTVHIHDGRIPKQERFDHVLYAQRDEPTEEECGTSVLWQQSRFITRRQVSAERTRGIVRGSLPVFQRRLAGLLPNSDTWVPASELTWQTPMDQLL
ncbi:MAG: hypothetical protein H8F28_09610 [Fibrella sp.]|nr:hypothetical protein [Armatimonadota bacterium]